MRQRVLLLGLTVAITCAGQTKIDLSHQGVKPDFSTLEHTRPIQVVGALPGTCQVGEFAYLSSAPAGQNLYGCTASNTWSQQSGSGGGIQGPGVSTNNTVVRWDGSTGALLKGSTVTMDDAGNTSFSGTISTNDGTKPGCIVLQESAANGDNFRKLCAAAALTEDLQITLPSGNPSAGQVLSLSAPSSGISLASYKTLPGKVAREYIFRAGTQNSSGALVQGDLVSPSTGGAVLDAMGTNPWQVVRLAFPDSSTTSVAASLLLPGSWSGAPVSASIDFMMGSGASSSQAVRWRIATACLGAGAAYDPSFSTPANVDVVLTSATANVRSKAIFSTVPVTGCAGDDLLAVVVDRDGGNAADTATATAYLTALKLVFRVDLE